MHLILLFLFAGCVTALPPTQQSSATREAEQVWLENVRACTNRIVDTENQRLPLCSSYPPYPAIPLPHDDTALTTLRILRGAGEMMIPFIVGVQ